jgi:hypothetical protein
MGSDLKANDFAAKKQRPGNKLPGLFAEKSEIKAL